MKKKLKNKIFYSFYYIIMNSNNFNNNLSGGIKQVDLINPIEMNQNEPKIFFPKDYVKEQSIDETRRKTKSKSRYIRMDNFMIPKSSNVPTIEEIKKKLIAAKIKSEKTFDEDEDESKFIKVVTIAPGLVYGVDTREYYPKKNVQVGPSISDMSG